MATLGWGHRLWAAASSIWAGPSTQTPVGADLVATPLTDVLMAKNLTDVLQGNKL